MKNNWLGKLGAGLMTVGAMFAAAFMTGCAEKVSDSGVSEETGIATKDTVTVAGFVQIVGKSIGGLDSTVVGGDFAAYPYIPRTIKFCTLDPQTFALSDSCETFDVDGKTSYELHIESTGWRYGLLSVQGDLCEDCDDEGISYQAIIDWSEPNASNVNILTTLAYDQVKKLVASGMNVEEAMARSEGDVLALLGIYGEYARFGQMNLSGTTKSDAVLVAATYLLPNPDSNKSIISIINGELGRNYLGNEVFWLLMGLDQPDEEFANLVEKYVANYLSVYYDLGRCNGEMEGRVLSPDSFNFGDLQILMKQSDLILKCEDGLWIWSSPKMEHVMGSMTDSRDGRVYKTTSFTVNGKTQTWMAEDLKYELPGSKCSAASPNNCENHGRVYTWPDLMQLDTTGFIWENPEKSFVGNYANMEECFAEERLMMRNAGSEQDSLMAYRACVGWDLNVKEMVASIELQNHQGVCPDGWRVPSVKDWNLLAEYIGFTDFLGVKLMKDDAWRGSMVRVADVGKRRVYRRTSDVIEFSAVPNEVENGQAFYASVPSFEEADRQYNLDGSAIEFGNPLPVGWLEDVDYYENEGLSYSSVRCIKAE